MSSSGSSWAICKSPPRSRQITMPVSHYSVFTGQMPFLPMCCQYSQSYSVRASSNAAFHCQYCSNLLSQSRHQLVNLRCDVVVDLVVVIASLIVLSIGSNGQVFAASAIRSAASYVVHSHFVTTITT